jgi:hypothetical protein
MENIKMHNPQTMKVKDKKIKFYTELIKQSNNIDILHNCLDDDTDIYFIAYLKGISLVNNEEVIKNKLLNYRNLKYLKLYTAIFFEKNMISILFRIDKTTVSNSDMPIKINLKQGIKLYNKYTQKNINSNDFINRIYKINLEIADKISNFAIENHDVVKFIRCFTDKESLKQFKNFKDDIDIIKITELFTHKNITTIYNYIKITPLLQLIFNKSLYETIISAKDFIFGDENIILSHQIVNPYKIQYTELREIANNIYNKQHTEIK